MSKNLQNKSLSHMYTGGGGKKGAQKVISLNAVSIHSPGE